jgi:hypothetical protein
MSWRDVEEFRTENLSDSDRELLGQCSSEREGVTGDACGTYRFKVTTYDLAKFAKLIREKK